LGRSRLIKGNKVLLIEDDFINMRLTQYVMEMEGYAVTKAATAREALGILESFLPDLILVDVQLPDIDGRVLVKMLRDRPETRDIKILALTACAMKGDREKMLQVGCDGYISKPIDIRDFVKTIRRFVGVRGSER
jgi:two-component system cell cycle response regulator DivK